MIAPRELPRPAKVAGTMTLLIVVVALAGVAQAHFETLHFDGGADDNELWNLYKKHNTGPLASKWHNYFSVYDRYLSKFRTRPIRFLEIGVQSGGSMEIWKQYFSHRDTKLFGLDINPYAKPLFEDLPRLQIYTGSQSNRTFLQQLVAEQPKFDIILDDGGHAMDHQIVSFEELYNHVNEGGIYIVEDTATSYWSQWGGKLDPTSHTETFIAYAKRLVDRLHGYHLEDKNLFTDGRTDHVASHGPPGFTENTLAIGFYDQMVVFERGQHPWPTQSQQGTFILPYYAQLNPDGSMNETYLAELKLELAASESHKARFAGQQHQLQQRGQYAMHHRQH